jgi:proline- and glutamine-rich splicing factor
MAMQQFGEVERAVVVVDDRGRSTGEGVVEFARKPGAQQALKRINDGVFLMTS